MRYYIEEALALAYGIVVSPKETAGRHRSGAALRERRRRLVLSVLLSVVSVWVAVAGWRQCGRP